MRVLTFKKGIHPHDEKNHTNDKPIKVIKPAVGTEMIFPMQQHLGAPCEPIVAKGDHVLLGQKIGEAKGFVSSPIHSSVSGVVKDIRPSLTPGGVTSTAIVIENDGEDKAQHHHGVFKNYENKTPEQILEAIKEAGIVGLGGAGFPTHIKLNPPKEKKIDFVIVNAAECEPFLTTDHRVLLEETERLVRGLKVMMKILPTAKGIIGVETNKQDAIDKLLEVCKHEPNIEVVGLIPKYPQGAEKQLIYACTGREVPSGGLPADVGCIVNNVDTVIAIERAVVRERPLIRRVITITGGAVKNPGNFKVRLGMSYKDLIEQTGGFVSEPYKLVSGGPMMGVAMFTIDVPIIKTSSAILCLTKEEAELPPEKNCIRCAKCLTYCPMGLMPLTLNQNVITGDMDGFLKNNGLDCIECGSCSYVCPAKRHLAQSIRATRRDLMSKRKK